MSVSPLFKFYRTTPLARPPQQANEGDAGYDLASAHQEAVTIAPHTQAMISTGLKLEFPSDHYARVAPRSGLAAKHSIDVLAGVVDSNYKGIIQVILFNHSSTPFVVNPGDRIAQLIFERITTPQLQEVLSESELSQTSRGVQGFGSTGLQ